MTPKNAFQGYIQAKSLIVEGYADESFDVTSPDHDFDGQVINMCARVPVSMDERLNALCSRLDVKKRRFIELAVLAAIEEAEQIHVSVRGDSE